MGEDDDSEEARIASVETPILAALCDAYLAGLLAYMDGASPSAGLYCFLGAENIPAKERFDSLLAALTRSGNTIDHVYDQRTFRFTVEDEEGLHIAVVGPS